MIDNWITKIKSDEFKKETKSTIIFIVLVFAFRSTFFEPFRIPSGSMYPTLYIGDFILANKFAYGFKVPYSDMFSDPIYITPFQSPKRGDVIIFKYPRDPSISYIKRVIGLPGDTVEIIDKRVLVNGKPIQMDPIQPNDERIKEHSTDFDGYDLNFYQGGFDQKKFVIQTKKVPGPLDNNSIFNSPQIVPKDHFFVMGDNRDFSADSRVWGFVPKENIKGRGVLVWFNLSFPFSDIGFGLKPNRIGHLF